MARRGFIFGGVRRAIGAMARAAGLPAVIFRHMVPVEHVNEQDDEARQAVRIGRAL